MRHVSLAAMLLSAGLAGTASADTLKIAMESRLGNLDPILSASHQTRDHGYLIYDTLFSLDAEGVPQPQMIESYTTSDDGKTYTFTLRDGLAFHDGTPVTSEDAIASIKRWAQRDRMGIALMGLVDSITAKDDKTFEMKLHTPSGVVIEALAKPSGVPLFIMPAEVAATPVTKAITDYTGSGPFDFVESEYEPGVKAVYVKNEGYIPRDEAPSGLAGGKVAKVDKIVRIEMADPLTATNALLQGEIDFVQDLPLALEPMVMSNPDITTGYLDQSGYQTGARFNFLQPPFDDKLIRQAAIAAIDQLEILQAQFGAAENYHVCGSVFGCGTTYESDVMVDFAVKGHPEKAKALLEEAGYDGTPVRILHVTDIPAAAAVAPVMAQQLRQVGFTVELEAMDFMTMLSRRHTQEPVEKGGWGIFTTSWQVSEVSDPLRSYMILAGGTESYPGWGSVPAIQEKIDAFLVETDLEKRQQIADEIQRIVYEEGIYLPLGENKGLSAWRSNVTGFAEQSPGPVVFWNVSKSEN